VPMSKLTKNIHNCSAFKALKNGMNNMWVVYRDKRSPATAKAGIFHIQFKSF
jgi:hypothetical protein